MTSQVVCGDVCRFLSSWRSTGRNNERLVFNAVGPVQLHVRRERSDTSADQWIHVAAGRASSSLSDSDVVVLSRHRHCCRRVHVRHREDHQLHENREDRVARPRNNRLRGSRSQGSIDFSCCLYAALRLCYASRSRSKSSRFIFWAQKLKKNKNKECANSHAYLFSCFHHSFIIDVNFANCSLAWEGFLKHFDVILTHFKRLLYYNVCFGPACTL